MDFFIILQESKLYEEFRDVEILDTCINSVRKTKARTSIYGTSYQFARAVLLEALRSTPDTD